MLARNLFCLAVIANVFCVGAVTAFAGDSAVKPHIPLQKTIGAVTPTGPVPSLAVINSAGAALEDGKLTLTGVLANSIVFADRPVRSAGHVATEQFIMQWDEGKDNFARNPPNATVSVLGGDGSKVSDAVVTLKSPKLDGNTLTFEVTVLEGSLDGSSGPTAVFIDNFSSGGLVGAGGDPIRRTNFTEWHSGNYWQAPAYHGAWYRSSLPGVGPDAIGDAPSRPYYSSEEDSPCVDTPFAVCY
jgi:hypothetical protein